MWWRKKIIKKPAYTSALIVLASGVLAAGVLAAGDAAEETRNCILNEGSVWRAHMDVARDPVEGERREDKHPLPERAGAERYAAGRLGTAEF